MKNIELPFKIIDINEDFLEKIININEDIFFGVSSNGIVYKFKVNDILNEHEANSNTKSFEIIFCKENVKFYSIAVNERYLALSDNNNNLYIFEILNVQGDINLLHEINLSSYLHIYEMKICDNQLFIGGAHSLLCFNLKTYSIDFEKINIGSISCLDIDREKRKLFIGLRYNSIYEIDIIQKEFKINRSIYFEEYKKHPLSQNTFYDLEDEYLIIKNLENIKEKQSNVDKFKKI